MTWDCPVSIDYDALQRVGDFQEEMASLRFVDAEDDEDVELSESFLKAKTGKANDE